MFQQLQQLLSRFWTPRLAAPSILTLKMKTIRTELLEMAYFDSGPQDGNPLLLLHGWPESPVGFESISSRFHEAGFRTIAPFLRGFGSTRFLSSAVPRVGVAAALAQDVLDLMDGLGIHRFSVIGHDWGARTGYALAALVPERLRSLCTLSLAFQPGFEFRTPSFEQSRRFWYQFFMCSDKGANRVVADPVGFSRFQWETWSPPGWFTEEDFKAAARAWENPDYPAVTLNSYRSRWLQHEPRDPRYDEVQSRLSRSTRIDVPTLMIQGGSDSCAAPSESEGMDEFFTAEYERIVIKGAGHFPHREATPIVAEAIVRWLKTYDRQVP
jgi:pimeloyl-ACP methyl ester carboxylesterase